jgi:hypothetical protein
MADEELEAGSVIIRCRHGFVQPFYFAEMCAEHSKRRPAEPAVKRRRFREWLEVRRFRRSLDAG